MDAEAVKQLKVAELRTELQKLGLPTTGRKEELQSRLIEAIATGRGSGSPTSPAQPKRSPVSPVSASPSTDVASGKPSATSVTAVTGPESDKKSQRAARFNMEPTEEDRKKQRNERFGSITTEDKAALLSAERLQARQERFGVVNKSQLEREDFEAQKFKRLERFGLPSSK